MRQLLTALTKTWTHTLARHQLDRDDILDGAPLCPACARVHGRCFEAVHPLLWMARHTGDTGYLDRAVRLLRWSDQITTPEGAWTNDLFVSTWTGTTVFGMAALAQALHFHGELLPDSERDRWTDRLQRAAQFVHGTFTIDTGNINYPAAAAAALWYAGHVLNEPDLQAHATRLAHQVLPHVTADHIIYGEGRPQDAVTETGCRPIDIAYNVEETLPSLALYARAAHDETVRQWVVRALTAHLRFLLPDGAWDNSWCSRAYKWAYWGSRTTDGCQLAYLVHHHDDPRFADAAHRNALMLRDCTDNGLLYGGPHYALRGEPACLHHTFSKARGTALTLDVLATDIPRRAPNRTIGTRPVFAPVDGSRTWTGQLGPWRLTVHSGDWTYAPGAHSTGGTLTLAWHEVTGPVIAASPPAADPSRAL